MESLRHAVGYTSLNLISTNSGESLERQWIHYIRI